MKTLIALLFLSLFYTGCNTRYREYHSNGQVAVDLRLGGDYGLMRDELREGSTSNGISGLLSGNSSRRDDTLLEVKEATQPTVITAGGLNGTKGLSISGPVDHTSKTNAVGHYSSKIFSSLMTGLVWIKGFATLGDIEMGKSSADVAKTKSGDGVEINSSNNKLEGLKNSNDTEVRLKALDIVE